ncbi:MAG: cytosine permease, partial [Raoultibacter sp.]
LVLLGVAIPPVAGIMVIDYYVLRRSRGKLDESRAKGELPSKVEKWNPIAIISWIAGFAVGEITSILGIGIPGLNSLLLAGVLYWVAMKIYGSIKKVDVVEFAETDQVF